MTPVIEQGKSNSFPKDLPLELVSGTADQVVLGAGERGLCRRPSVRWRRHERLLDPGHDRRRQPQTHRELLPTRPPIT